MSRSTVPAKAFPCRWDACHKAFSRKNILQQHIDAKHRRVKQRCPECEQSFNYLNDLRQHQQRKHEGLRPHHCRAEPLNRAGCQCGRSYPTRSELCRHYRAKADQRRNQYSTRGNPITPPDISVPSNSQQTQHTVAVPPATATAVLPIHTSLMLYDELARWTIHDYVSACWGSQLWFIHPSGFASSNKGQPGQDPRLLLPFNSVKAALSAGELPVAQTQLAIACQAAQSAIDIEHPVCFLDGFLMHLEVIAVRDRPPGFRACVIAFYESLMRRLYQVATSSHSPMRVWAIPIAYLLSIGYDTRAKENILSLGKLMLMCMASTHPAGSDAYVRMQLLFAKYEDDAGKQLREAMLQCSAETVSSSTRLIISPSPAPASRPRPTLAETELGILSHELMKDEKNSTCHSSGKLLNLKWAYQAYVATQQWSLAATIIADGILPIYAALYGPYDASQDQLSWHFQLESAWRMSRQPERADEAKQARLNLTAHMQAAVARREPLSASV